MKIKMSLLLALTLTVIFTAAGHNLISSIRANGFAFGKYAITPDEQGCTPGFYSTPYGCLLNPLGSGGGGGVHGVMRM